MTTISVFNNKGGVGKTSLTVNLAAALGKRREREHILVMDCDAQNNAAEYLMRYSISLGDIPEKPLTICDYLDGSFELNDIVYNASFKEGRKTIKSTIDVIASGKDINHVDFSSLDVYKNMISELSKEYDYCFIDCPPQTVDTALAAINAADYILIPITTENDSSFSGYNMAIDLINQFRDAGVNDIVKILGVVITKTKDNRSSLEGYFREQAEDIFGDLLFKTAIREAQAVNEAFVFRNPVVYYKKNAPVANDYKKLSNEFVKRIDKAEGKVF